MAKQKTQLVPDEEKYVGFDYQGERCCEVWNDEKNKKLYVRGYREKAETWAGLDGQPKEEPPLFHIIFTDEE